MKTGIKILNPKSQVLNKVVDRELRFSGLNLLKKRVIIVRVSHECYFSSHETYHKKITAR